LTPGVRVTQVFRTSIPVVTTHRGIIAPGRRIARVAVALVNETIYGLINTPTRRIARVGGTHVIIVTLITYIGVNTPL